MITPETPSNEKDRVEALNSYNILDTLPEKEYDQLTFIASMICDTPISLVSLVDPKRQWFKSHHGLDATETPRELAFCAHAINKPEDVLVVPDSREDERFHDNPLVTGAPNVIFYAGAPLVTEDGHSLGTLCVIDNKPKEITEKQRKALSALAGQVVSLLELRKKNANLIKKNQIILDLNKELDAFSYRLSHDLKTPVRGISSIIDFIVEDEDDISPELSTNIEIISKRTKYMMHLINSMLEYAKARGEKISYENFDVRELGNYVFSNCAQTDNSHISFENCEKEIYQSKVALSICFQNLITNSVKFNDKADCKIKVSLIETETDYEIKFSDNGPGISADYQDKIFKMFETLGPKSEDSSGIGLSTIVAILDKVKGKIRLAKEDESEGEGATFVINLPKIK